MLYIIVTILGVVISAVANAVADRLENAPAFNASIFYKLNQKFWLKEVSWEYARKIFGYKIDAWHLVESLQVVILILLAVLAITLRNRLPAITGWWLFGWFCALGALYNAAFNLFYNKLLKHK